MGQLDLKVRPDYRLLTEEQIEHIHQATLSVLQITGVHVGHTEGLQLLCDAGCSVRDGDIALIPGDLVEECIRSAPSEVMIYNRQGEEAMQLSGRNRYYGLGTDLITTVDLESGETRPSMQQDVANGPRVADYCPEIDFIASFALPSDVPTNMMYLKCFKTQVEHSIKPIFFTAAGYEDLAYIIQMAAAVTGGEENLRAKPFLIHYSEPTSPLTHSVGAISKLFLCAEKGIPICYTPAAMLGGSAPVTLAGGIVQANAEALSGLVLHQLKARGAPIISGFALPPLDMKTSCVVYAAPGASPGQLCICGPLPVLRYPRWSSAGSDAHTLDAQASMEHVFGTLMASLDGANLIHDVAYLGQGLLGNPAMIVMCAEIISYIERMMAGFDLGAEEMGLDTIHAVGPGGNYLMEDHTLRNFRKVQWRPQSLNRDNPQTWGEKGSKRYEEKVIEKTLAILASHTPVPLPEAVQRKLDAIDREAGSALDKLDFAA